MSYIYLIYNTETDLWFVEKCFGDWQKDFARVVAKENSAEGYWARKSAPDVFRGAPDELTAMMLEEVPRRNDLRDRLEHWKKQPSEVRRRLNGHLGK